MVQIIDSWATPLARNNKIFHEHDKIIKLARACTTEDDKENNRFVSGKPFINDPLINDLKTWILESVHHVAKTVNNWKAAHIPEFVDIWSWSSCDYDNLLHGHSNCSWSGIYCLEEGDSTIKGYNGTTIMFSPLPWGGYRDPGNEFVETQFLHWHHLNKGDLLLFPSYVRHSAKYKGTSPRTIIAFNIIFK